MRYFRARRYIHASLDGIKTFCGLRCNTFGCHWESSLWEEVAEQDFLYSPCSECKTKAHRINSKNGQQTKLNIFK